MRSQRERERETRFGIQRPFFAPPVTVLEESMKGKTSPLSCLSLSLSLSLPFDVIEVQVVMAPVDADPGSLAAK